ncbi:MAG: exodeoxyribonuclease VII large subunit [Chitinispirillales bacterium]|jgi:exodeoxyribonuclease VII large subunit|nr:exodeoxyribonuclease VII large subunit [Chitinispirillales bacterium]
MNDIDYTNAIDDFDFLTPQESDRPYTISEINSGIAQIFESRNTLVWVEGELSGWKSYPSGHCYFKLKDANSQIPGVIWKTAAQKLDFKPQDNMAVFAIASISVYEKGGYYQLSVHRLMPAGEGALHLAFEKLKEKLLKEGLFDDNHKKPLPHSVGTLGVVTSKQGAALWDIVRVVARRAPQTDIVIIDTPVQGGKAAGQIAKSIHLMNNYDGQIDLMIVGRGGGAIEDLWAFNEEVVARAIFESRIPIISAVGHEIDFTIADFVADMRAPTPSAAAEMAVADTKENDRHFKHCSAQFANAFNRYIANINGKINRIKSSRAMHRPIHIIQNAEQGLDDFQNRFSLAMKSSVHIKHELLKSAADRLNALSPLAVLGRGYGIVQNEKGATIRSVKSMELGDIVKIKLADGAADALVMSFE